MKYHQEILAIIFILNIFCYVPCFSQGWEWQNPLPTGNRLYCMDFVDSLTGWFGSSAGTILHTADGGNNWEIQHTGINNLYCNSIDFIDHQHGWATGNPDGGPSYILHTDNGGTSWTVQSVDSFSNFQTITFLDQQHGLVGGTRRGIYYTIDGGATWALGYNGYGEVRSFAFLDTLHGWAEGQGMPLLYTDNGGRSWRADTTGIIGVKVFFTDSRHGWITSREKVLRTVDGGKTWLDDLPKITDELLTDIFFLDTLAGWVTSWEEGTFRTTDGGWTWEQITTAMPEIEWGAYHFFTPLSGWIGFSRSWDGGKTLVYQKKGFTLRHILDVDFIDEKVGWVVGYDGIIAKTIDSGKTWHLQDSGTRSRLNSVFALNDKRVWVVSWGGVILTTKNGGETWDLQRYSFGIETAHRAVIFVDSLKGWIVGGNFHVGGWILHTEDGGNTLVEQTPGVIPRLFDVIFVNENVGWVVAGGGSVYDVGAVYHTKDGGETWIPQLENQPRGLESVFFINENTGWASGYDWIIHTKDGGDNWVVQSVGDGIYPEDLFFTDGNIGWSCGLIGKVFCTFDGGVTWRKLYSGTSESLAAVDFINKDIGWIVGDNGAILHTTTGGTMDVKINFTSEYTVKNFHLFPNYPNPFNQQTVISYQLPEKGTVRLTIYNILGREVITLVDKEQSSGLHRIIWDGKDKKAGDLSSGVYFYHLQFRDVFQETGKMILIR